MTRLTMAKTDPPAWLLAFWKEIDDKTFGAGFDCFSEDATCRLGVAEWNGREEIRARLRAFIDTGFTALHDVAEYWDGGTVKIFRGIVTMSPDDKSKPVGQACDDTLLLHGRTEPRQSASLVRFRRSHPVLTGG